MTNDVLVNASNYLQDFESDVITLVRRQVVYSEIVISKTRYEEIKNDWDLNDNLDSLEELTEQMLTDEPMKCLGDELESWMLFHGDVTSCSDDLICWTDKEWEDFHYLKY